MAVRAMRYAAEAHEQDMAHLIAHIKADPQAASLASEVEAAAAALKTRSEDWRSTRLAVVEAQTRLKNVEEAMRDVVRTTRNAILEQVHHRRNSSIFLTYFPRGLAAIFRASYADELRAVRTLAERLTEDPNPKLRDQAARLRAAADQMHAALEERSDALVADSTSYGLLQVEKLHVIATCRRIGRRLEDLYPEEQHRVRSCFRLVHHRARAQAVRAEGLRPATEIGTAPTVAAAAARGLPATSPAAAVVAPAAPAVAAARAAMAGPAAASPVLRLASGSLG